MVAASYNIVHTIYGVGPKTFGLGPVALNITREQKKLGVSSCIWCLERNPIDVGPLRRLICRGNLYACSQCRGPECSDIALPWSGLLRAR